MSLDSKLRALIEKEVKSSSKKTLKESVSDHELEVEAVDNGLEELIVCDANGNLTDESRDEIIQALKQVDQGKDELEEAYSDRNPKIDLYNKETGDYLASTNWSQTIEDAVTAYEKAYPDLAGNVVAELADGESEYQEDDEYLEDDELNEISKESSEDSDGDQDEFFTDPKLESVNLNDEDLVTEANEDDKELDDEDNQDELDLTSDETSEDNPDLDDEETEEEPEKITVVVVSPELKKDDAEDDDLDSSYDIDDEVKNVKKHTDALSMNEDLSDEFKEKAKVIFEAALAEHSKELRAKFIKEFRTREKNLKNSFNKQVKDLKESLIKEQAALVDGYLSEAIDTWIAENSVILESNVKTELTEEFIDGLKNLFQEHYIEVPTEKFDLVKAQEEKIKQLEESVSEYKAKSLKNLKEAKKLKCESIINKATSGMTEVDKAKFIKLVESVDFGSIDQFERKVKTLKESYTTKSRSVKEQVLTENRSKRVETEVRTQSEPKLVGPADSVANLLDKISF